jgi:ubiquinone/menaquinone biosynthesis C-methylase UbiE
VRRAILALVDEHDRGSDPDLLTPQLIPYWDRSAASYDTLPGHGLLQDDEWRAWRRFLAAVLGDPSHADVPNLRVLDVGTGTGVIALLAAELGHDVTGVDLSVAMLDRARAKAVTAGLAVTFREADGQDLPVDLSGFDVVISRHLLWTLPRPERAVISWRGALRDGGMVAVIDGISAGRGVAGTLGASMARLIESLRARPGEASDHAYSPQLARSLPFARQRDTQAVLELLATAGLAHVRVRPMPEVDRAEARHRGRIERLAHPWRRYLATGRSPILTAGD